MNLLKQEKVTNKLYFGEIMLAKNTGNWCWDISPCCVHMRACTHTGYSNRNGLQLAEAEMRFIGQVLNPSQTLEESGLENE